MGEVTQTMRTERHEVKRSLLETVYRGKATNIALGLFILSVAFLYWSHRLPEADIWHHVLRDFGLAMLISALLGTAYEYALRQEYEGSMRDNLRVLLENEEILRKSYARRLESYEKEGLIGIYPKLTGDLLEQKFEEAKQGKLEIKVLQTWTGLEEANIMKLLRQAVEAGCNIKVLLLSPESIQVPYRAHAQGMSTESFRSRILSDLEQLNTINDVAQGAGKITVKVYDATPVFHVFDFGTTKLMAPYWRLEKSVWGTQFEVAEVSNLGGLINTHFNDLWNDERPMDGRQITRDASELLNASEITD